MRGSLAVLYLTLLSALIIGEVMSQGDTSVPQIIQAIKCNAIQDKAACKGPCAWDKTSSPKCKEDTPVVPDAVPVAVDADGYPVNVDDLKNLPTIVQMSNKEILLAGPKLMSGYRNAICTPLCTPEICENSKKQSKCLSSCSWNNDKCTGTQSEKSCSRKLFTRITGQEDDRQAVEYFGPLLEEKFSTISGVSCKKPMETTVQNLHLRNVVYHIRRNVKMSYSFSEDYTELVKKLTELQEKYSGINKDNKKDAIYLWHNEKQVLAWRLDTDSTDENQIYLDPDSTLPTKYLTTGGYQEPVLDKDTNQIEFSFQLAAVTDNKWKADKYELSGLWMLAFEVAKNIFDEFINMNGPSEFLLRGKRENSQDDKKNEYDMVIYKENQEPYGLLGFSHNYIEQPQDATPRRLLIPTKTYTEPKNTMVIMVPHGQEVVAEYHLNAVMSNAFPAADTVTFPLEIGFLCRASDDTLLQQQEHPAKSGTLIFPKYDISKKLNDGLQYMLQTPHGVLILNYHGKGKCQANYTNQLDIGSADTVLDTRKYMRQVHIVEPKSPPSEEQLAQAVTTITTGMKFRLYFKVEKTDVEKDFSDKPEDLYIIKSDNFNIEIMMGKTTFYQFNVLQRKDYQTITKDKVMKHNFIYKFVPKQKPDYAVKFLDLQQKFKIWASLINNNYYFVLSFDGIDANNGNYKLFKAATEVAERSANVIIFELKNPTVRGGRSQYTCTIVIPEALQSNYQMWFARGKGVLDKCQIPVVDENAPLNIQKLEVTSTKTSLKGTYRKPVGETVNTWEKAQCIVGLTNSVKEAAAQDDDQSNSCNFVNYGGSRSKRFAPRPTM